MSLPQPVPVSQDLRKVTSRKVTSLDRALCDDDDSLVAWA
jgi:hypothetical protein